jgi:hypothetical protein
VAAVLCVVGPPTSAQEFGDLRTKQAKQREAQAREAKRAAKSPTARRKAAKLAKRRQDSADGKDTQTKKDVVSEIGIERHSGAWNSAPAYMFIVKIDLTFRYEGRNHVERIGKFTGTVPRESFDRLAQLVKDSDYMGLDDLYHKPVKDVGPVYTTVVMNGKRHVVISQGGGPKKLSEFEEGIDHLIEQAEWDERPAQPEDEE